MPLEQHGYIDVLADVPRVIRFGRFLRSFCVAEPRPFDLEPWVAFESRLSHFRANMLTFTVAIGPDEESLCITCLRGYIGSNRLFVLSARQLTSKSGP